MLIAGKTGSGKSTLLHILITNLSLYYSPREVQFYLIDFKKGVEFKTYAVNRLPHARVVAIESDREFGLSVLERLDQILQERGELFRQRGVQDLPSFRRQHADQAMPRLLLLIDEFQEFFTSEDRVSARAALLMDRLGSSGAGVRNSCASGIADSGWHIHWHAARLGQVAVRIALQCSESDAHLILSEENSAARLLSRPGEAIYNDANGMVEGNHPFQIAWLDEETRESMILDLTTRPEADEYEVDRMIVFEGNVPPTMSDCRLLNRWLAGEDDVTHSDGLPIWVGDPIAIADPVCIRLTRSGGQNLLIVGQETELADELLASMIISLCGGRTAGGFARVNELTVCHDGRDRSSLTRFSESFPGHQFHHLSVKQGPDVEKSIEVLSNELARREADTSADSPGVVLVVRELGQFRFLRKDEDDLGFGSYGSPKAVTSASRLADLIRRGPAVGIHVVIFSDSFNNAVRWLSSSLIREFSYRIAFRMNQTDSASLLDSPVASTLDSGRAVLYRDLTGEAEKFRPFSWPTRGWLSSIPQAPLPKSRLLKSRLPKSGCRSPGC